MKTRTKSTRQNAPLDSKSRKVSEEGLKINRKSNKKECPQTRKYLLKTLNLLQQHLKIDKIEKKGNNVKLSANVYEIVKHNVNGLSKSTLKNPLQDYSTQLCISKQNVNQINRSTASLLNPVPIKAKRRSNSALDQYFKDKFGSPAKDEEGIEKKLRLLKALKKSQQLATKATGKKHESCQSGLQGVSSCMLQEISDKNSMIMQKMRGRKQR